jgi:transposase
MSRSKGTIVSVKVPIKWESMTNRQRTRLSQITGRDTRVIRAYLGVINNHEQELIVGKTKRRIDSGALDRLTLTALRHKDPSLKRISVPHDFKARFQNISQNELQECRDIAVAIWNSYLERGGNIPLKSSRYKTKKIPRNIFPGRFELVARPEQTIRHWVLIRDSLDSSRKGAIIHRKLALPLKMSPFHLNQLSSGDVKSCRIVKDRNRKWWVVFAVSIITVSSLREPTEKPLAVIGIDLGISKAACGILLTSNGVRHIEYFYLQEKQKYLTRCEKQIASLQREMRIRQNENVACDKVTLKLRKVNQKRARINEEWDKVLVSQILRYAREMIPYYNLYFAVGNPKGIRNIARKSSSRGRRYRGMIHGWSYSRVILMLQHEFAKLGWTTGKPGSRFLAVYEGRTSITCHRCGRRGVRPKQSLFVCPTCGCRVNADRNGAINIARRMIRLTPLLRDEHNGLGRWLFPHEKFPRPKAARKATCRSKQKSQLPKRSPASSDGESAAVRYVQMDLCNLGDEAAMSDQDSAVENTAETSSVIRYPDSPRTGISGFKEQRTEATFRMRSHAPVISDNACATLKHIIESEVSDDGHELGRTQELQVEYRFHSPFRRGERTP